MEKIINYIKDTYNKDEITNIVEQGCINGAASFHIYYEDTVKFYLEFEEQIWDMLNENSEDQGLSPLEFIARLNGQKLVGDMKRLHNLLCWYAIEKISSLILAETE